MSRSVLALSGCFVALLMMRVPAAGQAMGEAAAAAGASSAGAAGAGSAGKSIGGMFGKLNDTLKSTNSSAASNTGSTKSSSSKTAAKTSPPPQKSAAPAETAPAPSYEDAMQIQKGIGFEELLRRFGPPAMLIATEHDAQTMSYIGKSGAVQVELRDGKVISVTVMKSGA